MYPFRFPGRAVFVFSLLVLVWAVSPVSSADSASIELVKPAGAAKLRSGQGYLLMSLDVGGTAPSIELVRIGPVGTSTTYYRRNSTLRIDLKSLEDGFYLAGLKEGAYQVVRINVPYFDLPYQLATTGRRTWRFNITEDKLNYIGDLYIAKERKVGVVNAVLANYFARDFDEINAIAAQLPEAPELVIGSGYRDDFYAELESATP